jgi:type IV pilus assembly protein PilW
MLTNRFIHSKSCLPTPMYCARQAGFTILELMLSLTIGTIIIVAIMYVLSNSAAMRRSGDRNTDLQATGRYALQAMKQDLMHAGFHGMTWNKQQKYLTIVGATAVANDCIGGGFVSNWRQQVWGANDTNPFAAGCIPSANYARGDVLVVRGASAFTVNSAAASEANVLHYRTAYEGVAMFLGNAAPGSGPGRTAAMGWGLFNHDYQDFRVETTVYYVGTCTTAPVTTGLCRLKLNAGPSMDAELVASGVEHMQLQFGVTTWIGNQATTFFNPSEIAGTSTNISDNQVWASVTAVRIWLLARAQTTEPGYANAQTYTMGDVTYDPPGTDGFRRQVFSTVMSLRNNWAN